MFVEAFGLRADPFMDTADPAFYYETIACANARRRLGECLASGRGLAVVIGPIGAGKTTLCNAVQQDVVAMLGVRAGLILDPTFEHEAEFLRAAAASLEIDVPAQGDVRAVKESLKRALFASIASGIQYVLFVDEAQLLAEPFLETLRSLLNFQTDERKLLALALSGQMELSAALRAHPGLTDRISMWLELGPLSQSEAAALLDYRLHRAGFSGERSPFSVESAATAWRRSSGLPRRLTAIAREAMEVAAERRARTVDIADVEAALTRLPPVREDRGSAESAMPARAVGSASVARSFWPWTWFGR